MNHFELFAHGESFDVDAYVASSPLRFDLVWHGGDGCYQTSGVSITLGDGATIGVFEQERLAREFLCTNREVLRELGSYPGVETFILGLHYQAELTGGTSGFCLGPPPGLMSHCLDIGIRPVYYVVVDRKQEWEAAVSSGG